MLLDENEMIGWLLLRLMFRDEAFEIYLYYEEVSNNGLILELIPTR